MSRERIIRHQEGSEPGNGMRCQTCGRENPDSFAFCPICGNALPRAAEIDRNAIKAPKEEIAKAVARRTLTDKHLSPTWIFFLIAVLVVTAVVGVSAIFAATLDLYKANPDVRPDYQTILDHSRGGIEAIVVGDTIYYVCLGYLVFMLVKRLNDHFARDDELRKGILGLVGSASSSGNLKTFVAPELSTMEEMDNESLAGEERRSPIFWTLLIAVIPMLVTIAFISAAFWGGYSGTLDSLTGLNYLFSLVVIVFTLYMFNFLGKSMFVHDRRNAAFYSSARKALSKLGFKPGPPYSAWTLPERSFWLYLLLSIVTVGIFTFYWWYSLLKDPNEHFKVQWQFEDNLMSTLQ